MSTFDSSDDDASMGGGRAAPSAEDTVFGTPAKSRSSSRSVRSNSGASLLPATPTSVPATPIVHDSPPEGGGGSGGDVPLTPLSDMMGYQQHTDNNTVQEEDANNPNIVPDDDEDLLPEGQQTFIRGTDVHARSTANAFREFLRNFKNLQEEPADDDDSLMSEEDEPNANTEPMYLTKLQEILANSGGTEHTQTQSLDIDAMHLYYHNRDCQKLYHQLESYPAEVVPLLDLVLKRELERLASSSDVYIPPIQVRPFNLRQVSNLRCLDPVKMDSLICLRGMVVRSSPIIPDLKVAHFACCICGHAIPVTIDRGRIDEPHSCPTCHVKESFSLQHNRCVFADKQMVRLQETPDEVPAGQTPASLVLFCFDDLVDTVKPGDRVEVTGVLRAQPKRVHPKISKLKAVYKTHVDVIHFRRITGMEGNKNTSSSAAQEKSRSGMQVRFTPQRIQELKELSESRDIYERLTASLAPSIWELDDIKKGVLCMLFGGNSVRVRKGTADKKKKAEEDEDWSDDEEEENEGTKLSKRGDINILLCGDPGTSKSQLLSYVNKLSSRGVYTSGKGSSAVGLTASVVRDPETKELVLESGALVLSDLGICCIDEFDKMSDTTRAILHEAMEQQTVSIAKAGIIATLNSRTSVLASANPTESRYNPNMSVVENIQLPPTLLSRFDLIYLILDTPNVEHDRRLAQHLVGLYYETPNVVQPPLDQSLLRDYIDYARDNIHPELSDGATQELLSCYLEMRQMGNTSATGTKTISATPRQLESLIRLSEALAKMRYSHVVTRNDAREAARLMKVATQAAATDPRTGKIDMDMITTGRTAASRDLEESLSVGLKELLATRRGTRMAVRDVTRELTEVTNMTVAHDEVIQALRTIEADGFIQLNERAQTIFVRTGVVSN